MSVQTQRKAFTIWELVVVLAVIAVAIALLLPSVRYSGEAARRNSCTNKLHQIGIALQNYHDTYRCFPRVSTSSILGSDLPTTSNASINQGYSWLVKILPYLEETTLYAAISKGSSKFEVTTDSTGVVSTTTSPWTVMSGNVAAYTLSLNALVCPSYTRDSTNAKLAGISNYVALSSTHIGSTPVGKGGMGEITVASPFVDANGTIIPNKESNLESITDGISKTVIVCESREDVANAWIDGGVNWVVGGQPVTNGTATAAVMSNDANRHLYVVSGNSSLNVGPFTASSTSPYYRSSTRRWGPSSEHNGGVVMHVYADASVRGQTDNIDPTVYLHLITRTGGEKVIDPAQGN